MASRAVPGSLAAGERGQFLGPVGVQQGVEQRAEVALHHLVEVVGGVADAVVGEAVLREVVRADALAAVAGADLGLAVGGAVGQSPGLEVVEDAGREDPQGAVAVAVLALLGLVFALRRGASLKVDKVPHSVRDDGRAQRS